MKRSVSLARLSRIAAQLREEAEGRLGRLRARAAALEADESATIAALNAGDPRRSALGAFAGERLARLHRERLDLSAQIEAAEEEWRALATRALAAERLQAAAALDERREAERKALEEIAAQQAVKGASSA